MNEKVVLNVEGMDCAHCAMTITQALKKEGLEEVNVNFLSGEVSFVQANQVEIDTAKNSIKRLGYRVVGTITNDTGIASGDIKENYFSEWKFYVSLIFTIPLVMHMFFKHSFLGNPFVQLLLALPVITIGVLYFGRSAYYSVRSGVPNMDVLIFTGSMAAFIYSIAGIIIYQNTAEIHNYLFFETSATIITLVLLGNLIEQRSVKKTTEAISSLSRLQPSLAKKIIVKDGREIITEINSSLLVKGDMVKVNTGDKIPADGKIVSGKILVDESMITGESQPVYYSSEDHATGGTIVTDGQANIFVLRTGNDSTLSKIIELVKTAQNSRPQIQKLGDRISAIFVPAVLIIALLTFFITWLMRDKSISDSLMNSIAVLVISCPCAMGLATPTAVMAGIGRAAQNGILIKGGNTIEELSKIKTIIFDKTGTLTTGNFRIKKIETIDMAEQQVRSILFDLEKNSSHPIAKSLQSELSASLPSGIKWKDISEDKGIGINGTDSEGNIYSAGSFQMVKHFYEDLDHDVFLLKNNSIIGIIDLQDEIKNDSREVISALEKKGIQTVLLSGDRHKRCADVAERTGIKIIHSEKLPAEKLEVINEYQKKYPVAMVGDGINDAPALVKASIGISISNATDVAIQSSRIILLAKHDLKILLKALTIGKLTYTTIKQNLFWAFFYNIIAIPVAAAGFLNPMVGALSMAFSDVIVIGNSLRLKVRKID